MSSVSKLKANGIYDTKAVQDSFFIFLIKKRGRGMDAGRGKLRGLLLTVVVSKVNLGDRTVLQSSALQGGRVY